MQGYRRLLEELDEISTHEKAILFGETPDLVLAGMLRIFSEYEEVDQNDWLDQCCEEAIDRVFSLVAAASGEESYLVKAMLYRAAAKYAFANQTRLYEGFEDRLPWSTIAPAWKWPVVNRMPGNGDHKGEFREFSALKMFGYTVGRTRGWPENRRREFLKDFMELDLPPVVLQCFGDEYGGKLTTTRLRKVANVIASNCGLRIRQNPQRFMEAIGDWEYDLDFLKQHYYEGQRLRFVPWPDPRG